MHLTRRLTTTLARLRHDRSGLALLEFAYGLPLVLAAGLYGIETANLALVNLRISQIALNLADNASRVGLASTLNTTQLRELDVNDVLQAARLQGAGIKLTTYGRVTLSSLENVKQSWDTTSTQGQRIHWQRCIGMKNATGYSSSYGTTGISSGTDSTSATQGTAAPLGMGDAGSMVNAPPDSGVMFVEINYLYQPIVANWLRGNSRIHYVASFIVRDRRQFAQLFNFSPAATASTCNLFTA